MNVAYIDVQTDMYIFGAVGYACRWEISRVCKCISVDSDNSEKVRVIYFSILVSRSANNNIYPMYI